MDNARNTEQERQYNIDPEMRTHTYLQKCCDRGDNDRKNDLQNCHNVPFLKTSILSVSKAVNIII